MTSFDGRRPLEDLLTDLASGFAHMGLGASGVIMAGVRPISVMFDLPVEARVGSVGGEVVVLADVPRTRTRTAFDLPLGRLSVGLVVETAP